MTNREKFIKVVEMAFNFCMDNEFALDEESDIYDDAMEFFEKFKSVEEKEAPLFTKNGAMILQYIRDNIESLGESFTAKAVGEGLGVTSRTASGTMRKLKDDGYLDKVNDKPVVYSITAKGLEVNIEENN